MITYLDRYEKKFFINYNQENNIKKKITKIFERDTFCKNGSYFCLSIYFDDNNFTLLKHKQEGLTDRFKLRLRTYLDNPNSPLDFWNLELKKKNNTRVKKKKIKFENYDVLNFLKSKSYNNFQNCFHESIKFNLYPKYFTFYLREAYTSKLFPHCRITFDKYIQTFEYDYSFLKSRKFPNNFVINPDKTLLELKFSNFIPNTLMEILNTENLNQITFSKYVDGVENFYIGN